MKKNVIVNLQTIDHYLDIFSLRDVIPKSLQTSAKLITLNEREMLILQKTKPVGIFLLVEGTLQVGQYDTYGSSIIFAMQEPLSVIGDLEFFCSDCENKTLSTVEALQPSKVILLPANSLYQDGFNDSAFLMFICQHLARKVYDTSLNKVTAPLTAEKKLQQYLYMRSLVHGNSFRLIKREHLASFLGISVRQLSRAIVQLSDMGFIKLDKKVITVNCTGHST